MMKRKILTIAIVFTMLFTLIPAMTMTTVAAPVVPTWTGTATETFSGTTAAELNTMISGLTEATTINIAGELITDETITIPNGKIVRFTGDGTLNANGGNFSVVTVSAGGELWLDGNVTITGGNVIGTGGGGVCLSRYSGSQYAKFTMSGGTISGNTAYGNGGGVMIYSGSIIVSGNSRIINNTATTAANARGGGIHASYHTQVEITSPDVIFGGNRATRYIWDDPSPAGEHDKIKATRWTKPFTHIFNDFDIAICQYTEGKNHEPGNPPPDGWEEYTDDDPKEGITIGYCEADATIDGQTLELYRLFDATTDGESYAYTLNPAFSDLPAYLDTNLNDTDFPDSFANKGDYDDDVYLLIYDLGLLDPDNDAQDKLDLYNFSKILETYVSAKTPTDTYTGTTGETSHTFADTQLGYYLILGSVKSKTGAPPVITYSSPMLITNSSPRNICMKVNAPTIEKTIDKPTTEIGETRTYTITGAVPNMAGYIDYTYIVHDTMSAGLTFDPASLTVTVGGTLLDIDVDYELTVSTVVAGTPTTIKIEFLDFYDNYKNQAGAVITVRYNVVINEYAVIYPADGNKNKAELEYTRNPGGETTKTPPREVKVYTFRLEIEKFDKDTPTKKLENATFSLLKNSVALKFTRE